MKSSKKRKIKPYPKELRLYAALAMQGILAYPTPMNFDDVAVASIEHAERLIKLLDEGKK